MRHRRGPCAVAATIAVALVVATVQIASAEKATVLGVEGTTVYFAPSDPAALKPGDRIALLRTIKLKRPDTGAEVIDHFPLGTVRVVAVGAVMAYGTVDAKAAKTVTVGDVVVVGAGLAPPPRSAPKPTPTGVPKPTSPVPIPASEPEPDPSAELHELMMIWRLSLGKRPEERVDILRDYLTSHPDSPYAAEVAREVGTFLELARKLHARRDRITPADEAPSAMEEKEDGAPRVRLELPSVIAARVPFHVAMLVVNPERVAAATLFFRKEGEEDYLRIPMEPDGDGYYRTEIPGDMIKPPALELFVEVADVDGRSYGVEGSPAMPALLHVEITKAGDIIPPANRTAIRSFIEYVDWNRFKGNDWHLLAETDVLYRVMRGPFYGVRVGFGLFYGRGGAVTALDGPGGDEVNDGERVGINYAYTEAELRFGKWVGLAGRLLVGQTVLGDGAGGELRLRLGPEAGTSLVVAGALLSPSAAGDGSTMTIGALGELRLSWTAVKNFPMSAAVIVTNQPAAATIGVRLLYELSWKAFDFFQPTLRLGYQARSITHYGFSFGLGIVSSF